ncbi:MAG: DUF481 domain-containing protein [Gammaproteobacteria bacterium]|nr:DUF481 domain-containing protein [Gammaproteobacteria bacterium]
MNTFRLRQAAGLVLSLLFCASSWGDIVTTKDGARLTGKVQQITQANVQLATSYAGTITIDTAQIETLDTDEPLTSRLADGQTFTGITTINAARGMQVAGNTGRSNAQFDQLLAAWLPDAQPPVESGIEPPRKWVYSVGADIAGKKGNSDEFSTNIVGDAVLASLHDELRLYGSYERGEQNGVKNSDEAIAGASYSNYFEDDLGWYVRGEIERDDFEDIDLRTTVAGGLTWRPINTDQRTLRLWGGVGYRYESFTSGGNSESPTLDLGLNHRMVVKDWLVMTNALTFSPQFKDFADYLFVHDSAFEMPIGASRWTVRIGLRNDYKNQPAPGRKKLDTAYYTRLLLRF